MSGKAGRRIRSWIENNYGETPEADNVLQGLLVNALDSGKITAKEVQTMTGAMPQLGFVRYDQWWVTASMNGMVAFITASVRYDHPDMQPEKVARWPMEKIIEASRIVDQLTSVSLGNG